MVWEDLCIAMYFCKNLTGSCSPLGFLQGLSCRKCNSVSCWPSWLRDQHVTHLLSHQRWCLCELLAGKGLMREGKGNCLPLPVIWIFIQSCIFPTCFMIPSVVPQTAVGREKQWHWRGGVMKPVYCPGRRSSKGQDHIQSRLWGEY